MFHVKHNKNPFSAKKKRTLSSVPLLQQAHPHQPYQ